MSATVKIPGERVHLQTLSNSALSCFRRCPREYRFRYIQLRRPRRSSEALRFGSFFHHGLNAWWGGAISSVPFSDGQDFPTIVRPSAEDRFETAIRAMRDRADAKPEDADPFELVKAEELILGYTARWGDEDYETIAVEQVFDMPLINPQTGCPSRTYRVQGALDAIARTRSGKVLHVESKTTSNDITQGSDYWRKVSALDSQVSTYHGAMRSLGYEDFETLYDVVRKVTIRPSKATPEASRKYTKDGRLYANQRETDELPEEFRLRVRATIEENPERYFARGPIVRLEADAAEHASDIWQTAAMVRMSENANAFPRSPNACERFGRLCDFFEVCSGNASIGDETRFRTAKTPHEELSKEV